MKLAIICPSNMSLMPYVNNYMEIIKQTNVSYTIFLWDRLKRENEPDGSCVIYSDKKTGYSRNYLDYIGYKRFVAKHLEDGKYDKIIVFTLQLGYFFKKVLLKNYCGKYIFDIRDYNKINKITDFNSLVNNSVVTVLSSPAFKTWLPESDKYIVNHNTIISQLAEISNNIETKLVNRKCNISIISVLRCWKNTISIIENIKNSNKCKLSLCGDGPIYEDLLKYIRNHNITNVDMRGRYQKSEEEDLYKQADMIIHNLDECKTALSNRLYNAAFYGKPGLTLSGTYTAELTEKYNIGLVVDSFDGLENKIIEYFNAFDEERYNQGRMEFLRGVIEDNKHFYNRLAEFINKS